MRDDAGLEIARRDEMLELLFWFEGEGLQASANLVGMTRFLAHPEAVVRATLTDLMERNYVVELGGSIAEYRLTEVGRHEASRRFKDEFSELLSQGARRMQRSRLRLSRQPSGSGRMPRCPRCRRAQTLMRVAIAGKGGTGKTTISGTLARVLARQGRQVLAIDADTTPNLAVTLGVPPEKAQEMDLPRNMMERQQHDDGTTKTVFTADSEEIISSYSAPGPDGVRLLVMGKVNHGGAVSVAILSPRGGNRRAGAQEYVVLSDVNSGLYVLEAPWGVTRLANQLSR